VKLDGPRGRARPWRRGRRLPSPGLRRRPRSVKEPRLDFEKNALATLNLLEAVRRPRRRADCCSPPRPPSTA
jgi:hypothetical protein